MGRKVEERYKKWGRGLHRRLAFLLCSCLKVSVFLVYLSELETGLTSSRGARFDVDISSKSVLSLGAACERGARFQRL